MEIADVRLKSPFTAIVTGPTGCGKTRLLMRLIESADYVCTEPPVSITYCYGEWQYVFDSVKGVTFHEGMIDYEDIPRDGKPRWLIIDDLMSEVSGKSETNNLFTKISHHRNVSVFFITQNPFKKENRTISLNAHYYFWFKNPRDGQSIVNFAKQAFPFKTGAVLDAYGKATKDPWSFMLIDMRQETRDRWRLIGNFASLSKPMVVYDVSGGR
jgi:hypothetical protein